MSQNIKEHLESLFLSLRRTLGDPGEESILEEVEPRFKKLILEFNSEAISYCLEKYIVAELDYKTPGNRGIGRMTQNIPRFGAYFRKPLSTLTEQEFNKLYLFILDLCLRGYLISVLYVEWPARNDKLLDKYLLFEKWIPCIYVINPYGLNPDIWDLMKADTLFTIIEIQDFIRKHGMEKDSLLKRVGGLLSKNKVGEILEYYIIAGFSLRSVEEGYY